MLKNYIFVTGVIEHHHIIAESEEEARGYLIDYLDNLWGEDDRKELMNTCELLAFYGFEPGYKTAIYMKDSEDVKHKLAQSKEIMDNAFVEMVKALQS